LRGSGIVSLSIVPSNISDQNGYVRVDSQSILCGRRPNYREVGCILQNILSPSLVWTIYY
jgi:hypothetical protein